MVPRSLTVDLDSGSTLFQCRTEAIFRFFQVLKNVSLWQSIFSR